MTPIWIDVFVGVVRDNSIAQVAAISVLLLVLLGWVFGIGNALASHSFSSAKMKVSLSAGDISNKVIGTLKSGYRPKILAALTSGATGPVCAFYANTSGEVSVVATQSSVNAGKSISFGGTFILA